MLMLEFDRIDVMPDDIPHQVHFRIVPPEGSELVAGYVVVKVPKSIIVLSEIETFGSALAMKLLSPTG